MYARCCRNTRGAWQRKAQRQPASPAPSSNRRLPPTWHTAPPRSWTRPPAPALQSSRHTCAPAAGLRTALSTTAKGAVSQQHPKCLETYATTARCPAIEVLPPPCAPAHQLRQRLLDHGAVHGRNHGHGQRLRLHLALRPQRQLLHHRGQAAQRRQHCRQRALGLGGRDVEAVQRGCGVWEHGQQVGRLNTTPNTRAATGGRSKPNATPCASCL